MSAWIGERKYELGITIYCCVMCIGIISIIVLGAS
jgi:hypothetical protein